VAQAEEATHKGDEVLVRWTVSRQARRVPVAALGEQRGVAGDVDVDAAEPRPADAAGPLQEFDERRRVRDDVQRGPVNGRAQRVRGDEGRHERRAQRLVRGVGLSCLRAREPICLRDWNPLLGMSCGGGASDGSRHGRGEQRSVPGTAMVGSARSASQLYEPTDCAAGSAPVKAAARSVTAGTVIVPMSAPSPVMMRDSRCAVAALSESDEKARRARAARAAGTAAHSAGRRAARREEERWRLACRDMEEMDSATWQEAGYEDVRHARASRENLARRRIAGRGPAFHVIVTDFGALLRVFFSLPPFFNHRARSLRLQAHIKYLSRRY
jgi:hypothetical protein